MTRLPRIVWPQNEISRRVSCGSKPTRALNHCRSSSTSEIVAEGGEPRDAIEVLVGRRVEDRVAAQRVETQGLVVGQPRRRVVEQLGHRAGIDAKGLRNCILRRTRPARSARAETAGLAAVLC